MAKQYRVFNRRVFSLMDDEIKSKKELKEEKELWRRRGFHVRVVRSRGKYLLYTREIHKFRYD